MDQAIYEVLTQEQKDRVQEILEEKKERERRERREYTNQQKLRRLKNRQEEVSWAYFMGYMTIILMTMLCGLRLVFIPGTYLIFDILMLVIILLIAFCVFMTLLFAL